MSRHLHYLHFKWKVITASMEGSIASMEASTNFTEAFVASMESFSCGRYHENFHASMGKVEAFMEASVEVPSIEVFLGSLTEVTS